MPTFEVQSEMPVPADELYDWHMAPGAFEKLTPPWQKVRLLDEPDTLEEGALLIMKVYMGPIGVRWKALHRDFIAGRQFVDDQVSGPFARWVHTHRFEPLDDERSLLVDSIEYQLPLGPLGALFGGPISKKIFDKMFDYRHAVTLREVSQRPFRDGLDLLCEGRYWEAHEDWEAIWKSLPPSAAKEAMHSLIQLTAACHKITQTTDEGRTPAAMQRGMATLLDTGRGHLNQAGQQSSPPPGFNTNRLHQAYDRLAIYHQQWTDGADIDTISNLVATEAAALAGDLNTSQAIADEHHKNS